MAIKSEVHKHWDDIPVWLQTGERLDGFGQYSKEYFEEGQRLRYLPERFECILDFVEFGSYDGRLVLEIGMGQGCDMAEFANAGAHVIGMDLSLRNCLVAQKRLEVYGLEGGVMNADAEAIPLPNDSVDDIYSFGVLHHTPDMRTGFREVERVLSPGGSLTMMLYRRNWSLWRFQCTYLGWLFLQTVKSDRWKRFYRRIGDLFHIKSFSDDRLLDDYQRVARARKYALQEICAFMTDGPTNPLSQFVTREDITEGFPHLLPEAFYECYLGPVPIVNRVIGSGIRRLLARAFGGFLFFRFRKPVGPDGEAAGRPPFASTGFRSLMVDPVNKAPLTWHDEFVEAENGDRYPVVSGVPVLREEAKC